MEILQKSILKFISFFLSLCLILSIPYIIFSIIGINVCDNAFKLHMMCKVFNDQEKDKNKFVHQDFSVITPPGFHYTDIDKMIKGDNKGSNSYEGENLIVVFNSFDFSMKYQISILYQEQYIDIQKLSKENIESFINNYRKNLESNGLIKEDVKGSNLQKINNISWIPISYVTKEGYHIDYITMKDNRIFVINSFGIDENTLKKITDIILYSFVIK